MKSFLTVMVLYKSICSWRPENNSPVVRIGSPFLPTKGQALWYSLYSTLPTLKSDILIMKGRGGGGAGGIHIALGTVKVHK